MKLLFLIASITLIFILSFPNVAKAQQLIYSTGFENAVTNPRGWYLNLDPDPVYGVPLSNYINGDGHQWIEGNESRPSGAAFPSNFPGSHRGNRCLGLYYLQGSTSADRSNIALWTNPWAGTVNENPSQPQPDLTGNEFYISEWLFLPDFVLGSTTDQWYGIFQYSNILGNAYPYYQFEILGHTGHTSLVPENTMAAVLDWRDESGLQHYYQPYQNFQNILPIGRWFKLEWYTLRDATNGIIRVWVDGVKIFDMNGINTKHVTLPDYPEPKGEPYSLDVARIYMGGDSNPHWLFVDDIEIWDGIPTQESVILSGRLVDKTGSSIQSATISADSTRSSTNSNGDYSLSVSKGIHDINYSTQNLWILLPSYNLSSNQIDLVNRIAKTSSQISFEIDVTKDQTVRIYSDKRPNSVNIGGVRATEVFSLSALTSNTWFHDIAGNKLHMIVPSGGTAPTPSLPADYYVTGSVGTYTAMNKSGQIIMTGSNASAVISYVLGKMKSGQKAAFSGDFSIDSTINANVGNTVLNFSQATLNLAASTTILVVRGSNIAVLGGLWVGTSNPSSTTDVGITVFGTYDIIDGAEMRGFGYSNLGPTAILPGWGSGYLTIKNCILHDNAQHINFEQSGMGHNKVQNCTFYNSDHSPIFISAGTPYNEIRDCEFYNWVQHGLYITGSEGGSLAPGGNIISGCNFHDAPNGDALSIKGKNNTFYNNRFTDLQTGFSIHSQYDTAEANDNEIYNNTFTRITFGISLGIDKTSAGESNPAPTSRNKIHDNTFTNVVNCFLIGGFNNNPANTVDNTKIYYNTFISSTNIFPTTYNSGQPARKINTTIAYNDFGKTIPASEVSAIESWTNTMIYGNTGLDDFNVPAVKEIPPP